MMVLCKATRTVLLVVCALVLGACGLDVTFESSDRNRDLIAEFDPEGDDNEPEPDAEPDPDEEEPEVVSPPLDDHLVWDGLARNFLQGSCFDYDALGRSIEGRDLLSLYLDQLFRQDLSSIDSRADRVALWVNAYNAITVFGVTGARDANPDFRVDDGGFEFFRNAQWDVGGMRLSLDQIEHGILRGDAQHDSVTSITDPEVLAQIAAEAEAVAPFDPRLHFAINCASRSCPDLRPGAYTGKDLELQLAEQTERFLMDPTKGAGPNGISALFDWFRQDFEAVAPVGELIEMWRPGGLDGVAVDTYLQYDWAPNDVDAALEACQPEAE